MQENREEFQSGLADSSSQLNNEKISHNNTKRALEEANTDLKAVTEDLRLSKLECSKVNCNLGSVRNILENKS